MNTFLVWIKQDAFPLLAQDPPLHYRAIFASCRNQIWTICCKFDRSNTTRMTPGIASFLSFSALPYLDLRGQKGRGNKTSMLIDSISYFSCLLSSLQEIIRESVMKRRELELLNTKIPTRLTTPLSNGEASHEPWLMDQSVSGGTVGQHYVIVKRTVKNIFKVK